MVRTWLAWAGLALAAGCSGGGAVKVEDTAVAPTGDGTGTGTGTGSTGSTGLDRGGPVRGLRLTQVSLNQGVEVVLEQDGAPPSTPVSPLVANRPALLRLAVDLDEGFEEREVVAEVRIGETLLSKRRTLRQDSDLADFGSTLNFDLLAEDLTPGVELEVALYEGAPGDGGSETVGWSGPLDVQNTGVLEIRLIPVEYNADGSGRLPDLSDDQLLDFTNRMYTLYPAQEVVVTVGEVLPWNRRIDASGAGWDALLDEISSLRQRALVPESTYFYGLFSPEQTANEFCRFGCVVGLSYVGYNVRDTWARASIGLGFPGSIAVDTMPHEVGHAHGRDHAPCGVSGADRNYPHEQADIGVWGYDVLSATLIEPNFKDMMSYCTPLWVSDYTWFNLFQRVQALATADRALGVDWPSFRVDARGQATPLAPVQVVGEPGGERVPVRWLDGAGRAVAEGGGWLMPYSHLPGGRLVTPPPPPGAVRLEVTDLTAVDRPIVFGR